MFKEDKTNILMSTNFSPKKMGKQNYNTHTYIYIYT